MRNVAREMNLSETSFVAPLGSGDFTTASSFELRWFTPTTEVALCGHGTLAAAKAIFQEKGNEQVGWEAFLDLRCGCKECMS